jgi:hypothetical protein
MSGKTVAAFAGFLLLGLTPSFVDWQQSPEKRKQIVVFYAAAGALLYYGVIR